MNAIFHDLINNNMEVYIDDVVVKLRDIDRHLVDLEQAFIQMRLHNLKMNPAKYAFGVLASNFLGFLVHHQGIEVDKNKAKATLEARPPQKKKELQRSLGKINFLKRFIANSIGKMKAFSSLLRLKNNEELTWGEEQQVAFDQIKQALANSPILVPLMPGKPLKLYISAAINHCE